MSKRRRLQAGRHIERIRIVRRDPWRQDGTQDEQQDQRRAERTQRIAQDAAMIEGYFWRC